MEMVEVDSFALLCQVVMPAQAMKDENRAFPRWLSRFPVLHGQVVPTAFGLATDINDDGMCIQTSSPYEEGTVIVVEIRIPGGPIQVTARVRYSSGQATGLQFLNLTRDQRIVLLVYCVIGARKRPS